MGQNDRKDKSNESKGSIIDELIEDAVRAVDQVVSLPEEETKKKWGKEEDRQDRDESTEPLSIEVGKGIPSRNEKGVVSSITESSKKIKKKKKKRSTKKKDKTIKEVMKELEITKRRYEILEEEYEKLKERLIWVSADFENYIKRTERETEALKKYAVSDFAKAILPVMDNLELALKYSTKTKKSTLKEGIELIQKSFYQILSNYSIQKIPVKIGDTFDPSIHEALMLKETKKYAPGVITDIKQDGYFINDRLLRPVLVEVSKEPQEKHRKRRRGSPRNKDEKDA